MNLFIQGWRVAEIKSVKEVKRDARDIDYDTTFGWSIQKRKKNPAFAGFL